MFQKIKVLGAGLVAVLSLSGAVVVAQESQPATTTAPGVQQTGNRGDRLERRRLRHERRRGAMRQLNLTDQQKEQARAIRRANFESNKSQREEFAQLREKMRAGTLTDSDKTHAQELRRQLHASRQSARSQMASLLTAEQKTKLDEMIKNRQARRGPSGRGRRPGRTPPGASTPNPMTQS
jgi:Spy/CpxP family protein refolding chaperone